VHCAVVCSRKSNINCSRRIEWAGSRFINARKCAMRWRRGSGFSLTAMIATDVLMLPPQT
jgi:hypothetical protein